MIYFGTVVHVDDNRLVRFWKAGGWGGGGGVITLELY